MKYLKNLLIIKIVLIASLLTVSCDNSLQERVFSDVTEENLDFENTDYRSVIAAAYSPLRSIWYNNYYLAQLTSSDEIVQPANGSGWDDGGVFRRMHLHTWTAQQAHVNNMWNSFYNGVMNTNRVIEQVEKGLLNIPTSTSSDSVLAELRVARALYYWLILDNFGDAPLVTSTAIELPSSTSRVEIYNFVIDEINSSISFLKCDTSPEMYGRFNRWATGALLANIYVNAEVYTRTSQWENVIMHADNIINSGQYQLETTFKHTFRADNEGSPEIIFSIPFDQSRAGGFNIHMWSWHAALRDVFQMQATPWGAGSAQGVAQFVNTFDENDGRLYDSFLAGPQIASDGSPVLGAYDKSGEPLDFTREQPDGVFSGEDEGYRQFKFEVEPGAEGNLNNDFPFFRYAQVLMMKAEASLRMGNSNEAAALVTQVRMRAFDNQADATINGADLLADSVYEYGYVENYEIVDPGDQSSIEFGGMFDELGYEFAWEGHRRRDMIRFGVFTTKSWLSHRPNGEYRVVFPIPQNAVDTNPNLNQNPNY